MKLWSKEALVSGGIYGVLDIPLSLLGFESLSEVLLLLFIICMLMLCFNKTPKFLTNFITDCPKSSYYLSAIGWVPYFIIITTVIFLGSTYFLSYSEEFVARFLLGLAYAGFGLAFISLVIAFIRTKHISSKSGN